MNGAYVTEHSVSVPLDWAAPQQSETIEIFASEFCSVPQAKLDLPILLYLQGGPSGQGPRPATISGWLQSALKTHRVVCLDQRGTGRSHRIDGVRMAAFSDGELAADFLSKFGADSIIRDAEYLRQQCFDGRKWSTLGQSYGGFLTLSYLSFAPEALQACLVAGGLPSLTPSAAEVYRRTYPRTRTKNAQFQQRYPQDLELIAEIANLLEDKEVRLPDGDQLTVRRFQSLGLDFGMKPGFERLHWLLDDAFGSSRKQLSESFLEAVQVRTSFRSNPLFAVLQENIYGHGLNGPSSWAAQTEHELHPDFAEDQRPLLFTGEMIFPWMFQEIAALVPFQPAVEALANRAQHPEIYDVQRLASNEVPLAAVVYFDDMYVDSGLQLETAAKVANSQTWVTNEFEHDGIAADGVFERLNEMINNTGGIDL
ncbi:proline iminopeptidase [Renibacterium salmoninarum ATCC 33209]|uniref:Proline iminopeptidase n=1 Tax=Renibacterium salmoninarum (strain ATCC 33209 / DSM 20767 / JCM 11484 / NBRC 15589 / NCIMB 2235) TaxID=288705 RepID=A9WN22_RENSM|nr:proline iminopeptidase [Renibacterium salmoninarum ATCC 33209]